MFANFDWMSAMTSSPIFVVLILCSIGTFAVAMERCYYFWKRRENVEDTLSRAMNKIDANQMREALWACETSVHPMGPVACEIIKNIDRSLESIEERMHIALSRQKLLLERNLNVLGTMAAVAPLIGLLGTVWGIMRAFYDMAQTGSAAPTVVAAGVAEALVTTAAGLIIAVPALMLYNHFTRKMNVMLTEAENHSRSLRAALLERGQDSPHRQDPTGGSRPSGDAPAHVRDPREHRHVHPHPAPAR